MNVRVAAFALIAFITSGNLHGARFADQAGAIRLKPDPASVRLTASVQRAAGGGVTFARDIAPILYARCSGCHHPGGPAPFSLLTYESAKPRAELIASATRHRYMPPWKADPVPGGFVGQQRLTDAEIDLIQRWADGGALEGEPGTIP